MGQEDRLPWWYLTRTRRKSLWLGGLQLLPVGIVCFVLLSGIDPNPPVWTLVLTVIWSLIAACYLASALARPEEPMHREPADS